jgi:hypothetical protein
MAGLKTLANSVAAHMRQHRVKILGLMAHNVKSSAAKDGYKAFIEANDMLEGIVAIQYSPYAGGEGEIYWIKNKNGFDIPVVTAKFSIWDHGGNNAPRQGSPAWVAKLLRDQAKEVTFSLISVHAWSNFREVNNPNNYTAEMQAGNPRYAGAGAAKLCANYFDDKFEVVNPQELIWRIRMFYREEQTNQYLEVIQ